VEQEETSIARQRLGKHVFAATDTQATTEELLGTMFCIQSVQSGVEAGSNNSTVALRVVGGKVKGSLESETVKYGHESHGNQTRE
jgi:hypothetical protein